MYINGLILALIITSLVACEPSKAPTTFVATQQIHSTPAKQITTTPVAVLTILPSSPISPHPNKYVEFSSLREAQATTKFSLMVPQFIPDVLPFSKGWIADWADGREIVRIWYTEPGNPLDANTKRIDIFQTLTDQAITPDTISQQYKEVALDIQKVQVRNESGWTYLELSAAMGNTAHLTWREGDINYEIDMTGNWPAPDINNPHILDSKLLQIAQSLQPLK